MYKYSGRDERSRACWDTAYAAAGSESSAGADAFIRAKSSVAAGQSRKPGGSGAASGGNGADPRHTTLHAAATQPTKVGDRRIERPMQQELPDDRGDGPVVEGLAATDTLVHQVAHPTTAGSRNAQPPRNLRPWPNAAGLRGMPAPTDGRV